MNNAPYYNNAPHYTPKCGHQFCAPEHCRFENTEPHEHAVCFGEPIDLAEEQHAGPRMLVNAFLISLVMAAVLVAAFVWTFK